jgi:hypothetical protein
MEGMTKVNINFDQAIYEIRADSIAGKHQQAFEQLIVLFRIYATYAGIGAWEREEFLSISKRISEKLSDI